MKTRIFQKLLAVTALSLLALNLPAQDTTNPPPHLSFGVSDIIKLSQAKLSDDTIIQFINALGDDYALTADQIIYMRQQGVSEAVIKVMLHSRGGTAATIPAPDLNFAPAPAAASPAETPAAASPADATPAGASPYPPTADLESPPADAPPVQPMVAEPPGTVTILSPVEPLSPTYADDSQPAVVYVPTAPAYYPAYGYYGGYYGGYYSRRSSFVSVSSGNFYGHRTVGGFHGSGGFHGGGGFHGAGHFGGNGFHH